MRIPGKVSSTQICWVQIPFELHDCQKPPPGLILYTLVWQVPTVETTAVDVFGQGPLIGHGPKVEPAVSGQSLVAQQQGKVLHRLVGWKWSLHIRCCHLRIRCLFSRTICTTDARFLWILKKNLQLKKYSRKFSKIQAKPTRNSKFC